MGSSDEDSDTEEDDNGVNTSGYGTPRSLGEANLAGLDDIAKMQTHTESDPDIFDTFIKHQIKLKEGKHAVKDQAKDLTVLFKSLIYPSIPICADAAAANPISQFIKAANIPMSDTKDYAAPSWFYDNMFLLINLISYEVIVKESALGTEARWLKTVNMFDKVLLDKPKEDSWVNSFFHFFPNRTWPMCFISWLDEQRIQPPPQPKTPKGQAKVALSTTDLWQKWKDAQHREIKELSVAEDLEVIQRYHFGKRLVRMAVDARREFSSSFLPAWLSPTEWPAGCNEIDMLLAMRRYAWGMKAVGTSKNTAHKSQKNRNSAGEGPQSEAQRLASIASFKEKFPIRVRKFKDDQYQDFYLSFMLLSPAATIITKNSIQGLNDLCHSPQKGSGTSSSATAAMKTAKKRHCLTAQDKSDRQQAPPFESQTGRSQSRPSSGRPQPPLDYTDPVVRNYARVEFNDRIATLEKLLASCEDTNTDAKANLEKKIYDVMLEKLIFFESLPQMHPIPRSSCRGDDSSISSHSDWGGRTDHPLARLLPTLGNYTHDGNIQNNHTSSLKRKATTLEEE